MAVLRPLFFCTALALLSLALAGSATAQGARADAVYIGIVEKLVKQNWHFPRSDGLKPLSATIEFQVGPGGSIHSPRVIQTSGREDFDSAAMRAVLETRNLPAPSAGNAMIHLIFNSQEKRQ